MLLWFARIQQVADIIEEAGQTVSELEQQSSQINVVVDVIPQYCRPNQPPRAQRGYRSGTCL